MKYVFKLIIFAYLFLGVFVHSSFSAEVNAKVGEEYSQPSVEEDDMFAPVELDLSDYSLEKKQNKKFKLFAEKVPKPSFTKSEGQVWDESKLFRYNFYSNAANLRVLPSYGSLGSYVSRPLDENTTVFVGQDSLTEINGDTVNFSLDNYSYYHSGAKMEGQQKYFNYSVGAFNETDTLNQQLAAVVSTKPKSFLNSKGKFYAGGGVFSTMKSDVNFNTVGLFAQYKNDKLSIGAQISDSSYSKDGYNGYSKAHLLTKYQINEHLSLKNKLVKNFDFEELQGELGVVVNPLKDTDRLELEVTAANYQSQNVITRQRLKFVTSFKF